MNDSLTVRKPNKINVLSVCSVYSDKVRVEHALNLSAALGKDFFDLVAVLPLFRHIKRRLSDDLPDLIVGTKRKGRLLGP